MIPMFKILAPFKRLRGTPFDLFGMASERKLERALIVEFEETANKLIEGLSADNIAAATGIANLYLDIRGYGPVKEQAIKDVHARLSM